MLEGLLEQALTDGETAQLEKYLSEHGHLPDSKINLELVEAFAALVGQLVTRPNPSVAALENLLDSWAALSANKMIDELWPCLAAASYGCVGIVRPDWRDEEVGKLQRLAASPRQLLHQIVMAALYKLER